MVACYVFITLFAVLTIKSIRCDHCGDGTIQTPPLLERNLSDYRFAEAGLQIFTNIKVPCDGGAISEWTFYPKTQYIVQLHLAVFRQLNDNLFWQVGETYIEFYKAPAVEEPYQWISYPVDPPISVAQGDVIGMYYSDANSLGSLTAIVSRKILNNPRNVDPTYIMLLDGSANRTGLVDVTNGIKEYRIPALAALVTRSEQTTSTILSTTTMMQTASTTSTVVAELLVPTNIHVTTTKERITTTLPTLPMTSEAPVSTSTSTESLSSDPISTSSATTKSTASFVPIMETTTTMTSFSANSTIMKSFTVANQIDRSTLNAEESTSSLTSAQVETSKQNANEPMSSTESFTPDTSTVQLTTSILQTGEPKPSVVNQNVQIFTATVTQMVQQTDEEPTISTTSAETSSTSRSAITTIKTLILLSAKGPSSSHVQETTESQDAAMPSSMSPLPTESTVAPVVGRTTLLNPPISISLLLATTAKVLQTSSNISRCYGTPRSAVDCRQPKLRTFYDQGSNICIEYFGCPATSDADDFSSIEECRHICLNQSQTQLPVDVSVCQQSPFAPDVCARKTVRYFYNSHRQACMSFMGCSLGNLAGNNFATLQECNQCKGGPDLSKLDMPRFDFYDSTQSPSLPAPVQTIAPPKASDLFLLPLQPWRGIFQAEITRNFPGNIFSQISQYLPANAQPKTLHARPFFEPGESSQ